MAGWTEPAVRRFELPTRAILVSRGIRSSANVVYQIQKVKRP